MYVKQLDTVTCLNPVNGECEANERSLVVVLKQSVDINLLDSVDVASKQRRNLLSGTIRRLNTTLHRNI